MMAAGLEFKLAGSVFTTYMPPISALNQRVQGTEPETGSLEALISPAGKVCSVERLASGRHGAIPPDGLQEVLWKQLFADPSKWWDNRRSKPTPRHPDFKHKETKVALWLNNRQKPGWVDSQLATLDAGMKTNSESDSTSVQGRGAFAGHEGHLEVGMCKKLCEDGRISEAVDALGPLVQQGCHVSNNLFYRLLKGCVEDKDLVTRIHALAVKSGYEGDAFLATHLIGLYAAQGKLEEAMRVFIKVPTPDAYNWASIIFAYARHGEASEAIQLYRQMCDSSTVKPDDRIYSAVLKACAAAGDLVAGKEVHARILAGPRKPDRLVYAGLVNMYAKCGSLEDARRLFDKFSDRDAGAFNALLAGYAQQGMGQEALSLYRSMQQEGLTPPSYVTYVCLLQACASVGVDALYEGKQLHAQIKQRGLQVDAVLGSSLVNMYAKCGSLEDARVVFDELSDRDVVMWTAVIAGYAQQGMGQEALGLYRSMQQEGLSPPDAVTYVCLLQACASVGVGALDEGKQLHAQIKERDLQEDVVLGGSLVNMYAKCGSLTDARAVFDRLQARNIVAWNAILTGYAQQGMGEEALSLYRTMQQEGFSPDSFTFVCLLQACAIAAALPLGKHLHAQVQERGLEADPGVGVAVVNMYAKCGNMFDSQQVFDSLHERTLEAWNALISGYARQGNSDVVFDLFDRMRLEGIQPDGITFLSVLTVCSHVGLVDKGREYFQEMRTSNGVSAIVEHFICMVDLLGRAGHLHEALQMAKTMPFPPNDVVWHTLLGACRKWKNVEIGQQAFKAAVSVDEKDAASYVLMSNIYASAQMWEAAKEMQARRKKLGAWKKPGQSCWTDMGGVVHRFLVGDKKHPESDGIYARLKQLVPKMKKAGYVPHLESSLLDIPDDEKEAELCGHSEKLAIAYALNKTALGTTIHIVKNLRVCEDCHIATAYISKVEKRTIICRDASRFHVFNEGKCSCGDYW